MANDMIVRVQSPEHGTKRIQTAQGEKIQDFLDKIQKELNLSDIGWNVYQNRNKSGLVRSSRSKTVSSYKIKHGDMLYLHSESHSKGDATGGPPVSGGAWPSDPSPAPSSDNSRPSSSQSLKVVEDDVDQFLDKQDGRIHRERNEQFCKHGPQGKCLHCVPLEPYDEKYLASVDPPIKFLSFHSNLRKLRGGVDKGKFAVLENLSCKIKPGCTEHPPWPGGICTKCQPNAVTLNRQKYRHVDFIQFENPLLMDRFLDYWRKTGNQRMGFLFGRYEHHKDIPLGIKAVVAAIYEPPQKCTKNSIQIMEDPRESEVDAVASKMGLSRIGWIFTDIVAKDLTQGTVKHFRGHMDAHFLSAEECITAADFQNRHPNPCKLSPDGHFGSKFVTVVATGDSKNNIHFEGYQVSNQCMALVNDDCLVPTLDAPELGYVKESTSEQYVPDVFYKEKDSYGNEVTRLARPLPVEYLLVDVAAAFPVEPVFTFHASANMKNFPVAHREEMGEIQDFHAFSSYMQQFTADDFLKSVSDFHVLLYMATCDMLPLKDEMRTVYEAVVKKDEGLARGWSKSEEWGTVEHLMAANAPSSAVSRQTSFVGPNASPLPPIGSVWTCNHCTFMNQANLANCEMCGLPK